MANSFTLSLRSSRRRVNSVALSGASIESVSVKLSASVTNEKNSFGRGILGSTSWA